LAEIGGLPATNDYHLELDFIGSRFSDTCELTDLFEETNVHHSNFVSNVASGDFELAVRHRDLLHASLKKIILECGFYELT
jgi:hypothetical protein